MFRKPIGGRAKNWFDADDDDEPESLHSSESAFPIKYEEGFSKMDHGFNFTPNKAEVTAGGGPQPSWGQGVKVTRQVLVESAPV